MLENKNYFFDDIDFAFCTERLLKKIKNGANSADVETFLIKLCESYSDRKKDKIYNFIKDV